MGYGQITGGGPTGRYQIKLDFGEATRLAAIQAFEAKAADLDVKIASANDALIMAEAEVAAARQEVSAAADAYIAAGGTGNESTLAMRAALVFLEQQRRLAIQAEKLAIDARLEYSALKMARAQVADILRRWNDAVLIEEKPVWCVDFTEDGSGQVGTIEINGENDITLIAPGCRGWNAGDGTVSTQDRETAIQRIMARQAELEARRTRIEADLAAAIATETLRKQEMDAALISYQLASAAEQALAAERLNQASAAFQAQVAVVRQHQAKKVAVQGLLVEEARKLARWQNTVASDSPAYGDGVMRHTLTMSPEQSFVNLAILPGWQRHRPTYRWGTITKLDKDADRADVNLASATSVAQNLNINQRDTLTNVPVVYMTCNAKAFEEGDNVVVEFEAQDWDKPRVIGFLSEPKECKLFTAIYKQIGLTYIESGNLNVYTSQEKYKDEQWGPVVANAPATHHKFLGWDDGVATLSREDGIATEDIVKTAQYTYAPPFKLWYLWEIDLYATSDLYPQGQSFVQDWEVIVYGYYEWVDPVGNIASDRENGSFSSVVWRGQTIGSPSTIDIMLDLTEPWLNINLCSPRGPIFYPNFPSSSTETVSFTLPGSSNVYTVTGETTENALYPSGQIPSGVGQLSGGIIQLNYTPTSWSASYG